MRTDAVLSVRNLHVNYSSVQALKGATFNLSRGKICGLVGMNGSGKSSLIKAIVGTVRSQGTITIEGNEIKQARRQGLIGYVPQNEGVDWDFPISVEEVVMMGRYGMMGLTRRASNEDREEVDRALEMMDLTELRTRQIGALSGGQRKRVFIARAIAQGARLLLLDEPFAGVDKPSEISIIELLHRLSGEGATMLVATHDLTGLEDLCDEALLLLRKVIFHGAVKDALLPHNLHRAFGLDETEENSLLVGATGGRL